MIKKETINCSLLKIFCANGYIIALFYLPLPDRKKNFTPNATYVAIHRTTAHWHIYAG